MIYTESCWKSLAVKSLRMGWAAGLAKAASRLSPETMFATVMCGIFEDVFPPESEVPTVIDEIVSERWDALCSRETHHGRPGLTKRFCELAEDAKSAAALRHPVYPIGERLGLYLPHRALNVAWTWDRIAPTDNVRRAPDLSPWRGMPRAIADKHTFESRTHGRFATILSGMYWSHERLSRIVQEKGWAYVREQVHGDLIEVEPSEEWSAIPSRKSNAEGDGGGVPQQGAFVWPD